MFKSSSKKSITCIIILAFVFFGVIAGCGKQQTTVNAKDNKQNVTQEQAPKSDVQSNSQQNVNTKEDVSDPKTNTGTEQVVIKVPSMQCGTCKKNIEKAVKKVAGVIDVNVDKEQKVAHVNFDKSKTDLSKIENAITAAGYDANDKKADQEAYNNLDDCCKLPKDKKDK